MAVTKGVAKYVYLDSTEKYNGDDTGKYTLTVQISAEEADKLNELGVKTKNLKHKETDELIIDEKTGKPAFFRKFSTRYKLDNDMIKTVSGDVVGTDFGAESDVSVLWKVGKEHPVHGVATYLTAIKVADDHTPGFKGADAELSEFMNA